MNTPKTAKSIIITANVQERFIQTIPVLTANVDKSIVIQVALYI